MRATTNARTVVPSGLVTSICWARTSGRSATSPGGAAHRVVPPVRASNRCTLVGVVWSAYENQTSGPPSGCVARPEMEPRPGRANTSGRRSPVRGSCTLTSDTECRRQDASSSVGVVSAPPPSMNATSSRTAVGSSASSVVQCSTPGAVGSVTAIRPRGASRLVCTYSRPSRATHAPVSASRPTATSTNDGCSSPDAVRSAIHTSVRGAVPAEADTMSQRPSRETDTP